MRTYLGRCHCGAIQFRFQSAPITGGVRCNCSLCIRRGCVMSEAYYEDFERIADGGLRVYHWGDHMVNHYFCGTCGVHPFHDVIATPGRYRINLGCVDDVDPTALEIRLIDGRSY
jgi:hypothetical protein